MFSLNIRISIVEFLGFDTYDILTTKVKFERRKVCLEVKVKVLI